MNISNSIQDLASLVSRVEQLEAEQNVWKDNTIWLKRYFDELKQEFKNTPELQQIQSMHSAIAQLSAQVAELQQRLNHSPTLSNGLDNGVTTDAQTECANLDNAEVVKQFFERVEVQQRSYVLVDAVSIPMNADAAETYQNQEIDLVAQQKRRVTALSDEEFKVERMLLLLDGIYADEEESQGKPVSAEEFLLQYNAGQRDFTGINLAGVNLSGKDLNKINLSKANLKQANLRKADLNGANLREANLSKSNLSGAHLYGGVNLSMANLNAANLSGANLRAAKLMRTDLSNANLSKVKLFEANLEGANLQGANLQHSYYDVVTIFPTNFDTTKAGGYLIAPGVSLQNANLAGANLNRVC